MRPISLLLAVYAFRLAHAIDIRGVSLSSNVTSSNSSLIADGLTVPECSLKCVNAAFESSSCDIADVACLCTNIPLQAVLSGCVQRYCPYKDQDELARVEIALCKGYPVPFRGRSLKLASIILVIITIPIVCLRLFSRCFVAKYVGWDDYVIFLAACLLIVMSVLETINVDNGFGVHIWYILPSELKNVLQYIWLCEMFYIITLSVTKISILLFYYRIFVSRWFLISVRILIAFVALYAIAFTLVLAFQCYPVKAFWDRSLDHICVNTQDIVYASAAISVFQDFIIIILPIPELIGLQVSIQKRVNVMVMFSVGLFALATSCIRLKYLVAFDNSLDTTWDDIPASTWSVIELNVSIICACLPSLRALATYFIPSIFKSSMHSTHYYYPSNNAAMPSPSFRAGTHSRPIPNFITMPEDIVEQNYREEYEMRNANGVYYATRPLSHEIFDLSRIKTEKTIPEYQMNEVYASSQASTSQENNHSRQALVVIKDGMVNAI